jgi:primary-amine oxidase
MSRFRVSVNRPRRAIVLAFAVVTLTTSVAAGAGSRPILPRTAADAAAPVAAGPLDPLTVAEINETFQVIESYGQFPRGAFFPYVSLKEPTKRSVLDGTSTRKALAQVYDRKQNRLVEAVVDLAGRSIESWTPKPGVQPAVFATDFVDSDRLVRADPRWKKAMSDRGLKPSDVFLDIWSPGDGQTHGATPGTRLLRAIADFDGRLGNAYDRPIEGVVATVDMNRLKVIDVTDTGIRPVDTTSTGSAAAPRTGLKPLVVTQPDGPSFQISGDDVTWQGWHFTIGYTAREGLVLNRIGYDDRGAVRPIIYRLALDDIYVPYALPDTNWVWRTAFDIGEYNIAQYANPLQKNVDVPENAVFLDENYASDTGSSGGVFALPHAVAIYERDAGSLWDRTDPVSFSRDARLARELVVTWSFWIGNYIYHTDYIFRMDGGIDAQVGLTGTTLDRGIRANEQPPGDSYGTVIAKNIAAPYHQHFLNFRIDFDVDGVNNQVVEQDTTNVASSLGNAFDEHRTVLATEGARDLNPAADRQWLVESTTKLNALGEATGYELKVPGATTPYSDPSYAPLQRAPFAQHPIWVTAYRDGELYAGGDYPNQGAAGQGLNVYANSENTQGTDVVVWATVAVTHHPTVEEYPVMTTETTGLSLRPSGFFSQNPALDAPRQ